MRERSKEREGEGAGREEGKGAGRRERRGGKVVGEKEKIKRQNLLQ